MIFDSVVVPVFMLKMTNISGRIWYYQKYELMQ